MQIKKPLTNIVSKKVKNWKQIKKEAIELKDCLDNKKFEGYYEDALAVSHTQVSKNPFNFFVVNKKHIKKLGHWCIINPRILSKKIECTFPEACMSFMYRKPTIVNRYMKIIVLYYVPLFDMFLIPKIKKFNGKKEIESFMFQHEIDHSNGKNIYEL